MGSLDTNGLETVDADLSAINSVDTPSRREAIAEIREHYAVFGSRLSAELMTVLDELKSALN